MSSDSVTATAIGTAAAVKGAKLVLLDSGKCVNGKADTKGYGIIKMKSAGGFSADILMTQDSITKVRAALQKSMTPPTKTTTDSRASAFRLRVGTDIQFPKSGGDISDTKVIDEGKTNFVSDQNIAILLEIGSDYDGKTATLKVKDLTEGKLDESQPISVKATSGGGISQTFNLHLPAEHTRKVRIALELGDLKKETVVQIVPKP